MPELWEPTNPLPTFTARPEWSSPCESMWMMLSKFSFYNRLTLQELSELFLREPAKATSGAVDLRRSDRFDLQRIAEILDTPYGNIESGFCYRKPILEWPRARAHLRYCEQCLNLGFHAAWFQWRFISRCPIHNRPLSFGCPRCTAPIKYALQTDLSEHPLACTYCSNPLVPSLHRGAGRCIPLPKRMTRIIRKGTNYISLASNSAKALPRLTMPTSSHASAPKLQRQSYFHSTSYLRTLNRNYEVPPPTIHELPLNQPACATPVPMKPSITSQPCESQFERNFWPHIGPQFISLERVLEQHRIAMFGDTLRTCNTHIESLVRNGRFSIASNVISLDEACAIGWHLTWLGVSRTCRRTELLATPALGLSSWLAYMPDRPISVRTGIWERRLAGWLKEDLILTFRLWQRLVRFMAARRHYLLHPILISAAEVAAWAHAARTHPGDPQNDQK